MTIEAIRLQNFMAFQDTEWVELRPITLLLGRNSSGKSVLTRALLLLRQSLRSVRDEQPFVLSEPSGVDIGGFREMVHKGDEKGRVCFHFRCESVEFEQRLATSEIAELRALSNRTLQIALEYAARRDASGRVDSSHIDLTGLHIHAVSADAQQVILLFEAVALEPEDVNLFDDAWFVNGLLTEQGERGAWRGFNCKLGRGFLDVQLVDPTRPEGATGYHLLVELLKILTDEIRTFLKGIVHLGPIRPEPQRRYSFNRATEHDWQARDWTAFLDFISGKLGQEETDQINAWLQRLQLAAKAEARPASEIGALVAEREIAITEGAESLPLPLSAMGFGTAQVLPVIVQCVTAKPGSLVIVEQPELHLHPRGQAWLGDLYPAVIRKDIRAQRRACREVDPPRSPEPRVDTRSPDFPRYLLETHSEHLLLRLRRCIAETHLKSLRNELEIPEQDAEIPTPELRPLLWQEDVAAYFVERPALGFTSKVLPLGIDRFGDLPAPQGFADFFSDDAREILAITRAALTAEGMEEDQAV